MANMESKRFASTDQPAPPQPLLPGSGNLHLGIDIGSVSCKLALLDDAAKIHYTRYERTAGRMIETARKMLADLFRQIPPDKIETMAGTGSAGRALCELLDIDFINEIICQSAAIRRLCPDVRTLIEMGGQDSKIIFIGTDQNDNSHLKTADMVDFAMNTNCAAGTGSFLDQQASRLGINIENEFARLALKSKTPPRVAGRCSVFAKSDMIHLQQQATPMHDIVAGLCMGLARNLKSTLLLGKEIITPVAFCGGVAANKGVVKAIEKVFELNSGRLVIPDLFAVTGAIGAVLAQRRRGPGSGSIQEPRVILSKLDRYISETRTIGHRIKPLTKPTSPTPKSKVHHEILTNAKLSERKIPAFLGIDVGSISTNVVLMDEQKHLLRKAYLMTAGRPLEAVRKGVEIVSRQVENLVDIQGVATTGSGRYLTGDFVGADLVINEITAQATGAALVDPTVDTIFEIGGQDSKFISLENGVVVDFEMNHACAAGTGSFLEEQAERLGMSIKDEFANDAFASNAPIKLGERCTVFMESDLLSYQQQGAQRPDLVAGLAYSIVTNYLNRVVGHRKIGQKIFFQGGTAFNRAVVAAFEAVTGKNIIVPDHHEVTGAFGAAELARRHKAKCSTENRQKQKSSFRGFDLSTLEYKIRSFECQHCSNNCEVKEVVIPHQQPIYYGSRCDRYNLKKEKAHKNPLPDLFAQRRKMLISCARLDKKSLAKNKTRNYTATVGIPMCLTNYQLLPLWSVFFDELGLKVITSGPTTKDVIHQGAEAVLSQTCFPVKVAHGHILELIKQQVDYIWLPSIVSMSADYPENKRNQLCPYVQTIPYQLRSVLKAKGIDFTGPQNQLLDPHLSFQKNAKTLRAGLVPVAKKLNIPKRKINSALNIALKAQQSFENNCIQKGKEVLNSLTTGQKACVIVSRPYNGCDRPINLNLAGKLRQMNVMAIPMDFLDLENANVTEPQLQSQMYWKYGQKIFRAAHIIRDNPKLNAIYLSNFSCGPDSFIITLFKELMTFIGDDSAEHRKPTLVLEIDEHSADAGVVTRLEAFHESLKAAAKQQTQHPANKLPKSPWQKQNQNCAGRTLYLPWMGDRSYTVQAAFVNSGQDAKVLPIADEETLRWGRKFTSGRECLPCIITTGDMLKKIAEPNFDHEKAAFFMPGAGGPCRFGQYNCLQKLILKQVGFPDNIPIISPNQDGGFYEEVQQFKNDPLRLSFNGMIAIDLLFKVLLKTRPYEKQPGSADQAYEKSRRRIIKAIEAGATVKMLVSQIEICAEIFNEIPTDNTITKPVIGVVGEIYIRNHTFANCDIIRQLENLGAETDLATFSEWIYYTNLTRMEIAKSQHKPKCYLQNLIKNHFQHKIEKTLAKPLEKYFGPLAEGDVKDVVKLAAPYIHESFQGEAVLSAGKMIQMYRHGAAGAVSVGPFTCMPTNIVTTVARQISADCGKMPIISITYDGQQDPTLQTKLEAFIHQVKNFKKTKTTPQTNVTK